VQFKPYTFAENYLRTTGAVKITPELELDIRRKMVLMLEDQYDRDRLQLVMDCVDALLALDPTFPHRAP
jgi:hypothetical protein